MKLLRKKLKNGMVVIMEPRSLPLVSVSISNRIGGLHESSKDKGLFHFIEHLIFTGTPGRSHEDISREIERRGGILNAFTSQELTSYWFKLPSAHLFTGLAILHDILENSLFSPTKFEKERNVILEEIKLYRDNPQHRAHDLLHAALYLPPFGEGIIGSAASIKGLDRDYVYAQYKKFYSPSNYIVTIVGDAPFEKVCTYLEKAFPSRSSRITHSPIKKQHKHLQETRSDIDQTHYLFGVHAPLYGDPDYYAFEVLNAYLASGMSSRLFLRIREELGLAYTVKGSLNSEKDYANYSIYVGTRKEAINEIQQIILNEFKAVSMMSENTLSETKEKLVGLRSVCSEESVQVLHDLTFAELAGNASSYYEYAKGIRSVTLSQLRKISRIRNYATAIVSPS